MTISTFILIGICMATVGVAEAAMDTIAIDAKWQQSVFAKWAKQRSVFGDFVMYYTGPGHWKNKYKQRDYEKGPAFPFSTTILVWATDGWHFAKAVHLCAHRVAIAWPLFQLLEYQNPLCFLLILVILWGIRGPVFELTYSFILKAKKP